MRKNSDIVSVQMYKKSPYYANFAYFPTDFSTP